MGQVTIYIDPDTEKRLNTIIKMTGMSKSKWIANLIKEKSLLEWPEGIIQMAGTWNDFPTLDEIRQSEGNDSVREEM